MQKPSLIKSEKQKVKTSGWGWALNCCLINGLHSALINRPAGDHCLSPRSQSLDKLLSVGEPAGPARHTQTQHLSATTGGQEQVLT